MTQVLLKETALVVTEASCFAETGEYTVGVRWLLERYSVFL
jgi:hypothetical protein